MIAVLTLAGATANIADLSAPLERSSDYNSNPVQIALKASQDNGSPLGAYTVLEGGKIVAGDDRFAERGGGLPGVVPSSLADPRPLHRRGEP